MKDFTKGVLFVICIAGVYKLGILKGRKEHTEVLIEVDDDLIKALEKIKEKSKKNQKKEES